MAGRKSLLLIAVFFLGFVASPPSFNFWTWLGEVAQNPDVAVLVFYGAAALTTLAAIVFVAKNINGGRE